MKLILLFSVTALLVGCGGQSVDTASSSSTSSTSSSNSSSSTSSSSSSSSNSGSGSSSSSSSGGDASTPLTNAVWELRYVENELGIRRASNISMTLRFDDDRQMEGTTACGSFSSKYWIRDDAIGWMEAPQLPLNCEPRPWSLLEQDYYAALNQITRFNADDTRLTLQTVNNTTMVYEPVGIKCATPKFIDGEVTPDLTPPWAPVNVVLTTDNSIEQLIYRLRTDYPDLELRSTDACGPDQVAVSVNRLTLQYLRCRSDITAISYQ